MAYRRKPRNQKMEDQNQLQDPQAEERINFRPLKKLRKILKKLSRLIRCSMRL